MRPLIGLTTYRFNNQYGSPQLALSEMYTSAVAQAGGLPVQIPLGLPEAAYPALLSRLDGILFTGGGDIHPERYGSSMHPLVNDIDPDRDRVEYCLFEATLKTGLPFLGICRGMQLINTVMGGTLYEDILDQRDESIQHRYYPDWPRDYLAHTVNIEPESRLCRILGASQEVPVNSLHHQGVRHLAGELKATAYAPDGIVEAFELPGHPFGLAVQWHPEWLQAHAPMRALFRAFIKAADRHK